MGTLPTHNAKPRCLMISQAHNHQKLSAFKQQNKVEDCCSPNSSLKTQHKYSPTASSSCLGSLGTHRNHQKMSQAPPHFHKFLPQQSRVFGDKIVNTHLMLFFLAFKTVGQTSLFLVSDCLRYLTDKFLLIKAIKYSASTPLVSPAKQSIVD